VCVMETGRPVLISEMWSDHPQSWVSQSLFAMSVGVRTDTSDYGASTLGLWLQEVCLNVLDDHVNTCTAHSGAKKTHDWAIEQLVDLFHTTHRVKTQQVARPLGSGVSDVVTLS
jgi:hypothetical protein